MSDTDGSAKVMHPVSGRAPSALATMSPAYFGLVMATGIVSIAASMMGHHRLGLTLFYLNVVQYVVLWVLYGLRAWRYPRRFFGNMVTHSRGPSYFTIVAGTGILASQFMLQLGDIVVGAWLFLLTAALWIILTYTIFTALTIRHGKPHLDRGISGSWLLAVVATQAVSVSAALLGARVGQPYQLGLNLIALTMWLWGGMLYIWMMSLIFYRYMFFRFSPRDLAPPYWIDMGAMAISTLGGSLLIANAGDAPYLASMLPFLKGFTLLYWATGTWWIPMLFVLELWRYADPRTRFEYDPLLWGAVFPLGMYAACTWHLDSVMGFGFLTGVAQVFLVVAVVVWIVIFAGMIHMLVRDLTGRLVRSRRTG
jgi:tellurite resistance protein TehA-like permease